MRKGPLSGQCYEAVTDRECDGHEEDDHHMPQVRALDNEHQAKQANRSYSHRQFC